MFALKKVVWRVGVVAGQEFWPCAAVLRCSAGSSSLTVACPHVSRLPGYLASLAVHRIQGVQRVWPRAQLGSRTKRTSSPGISRSPSPYL